MILPCRLIILLTLLALPSQATPALFPLRDVKPGLRGECLTVFSGTKIQGFPFEVMGIARDFAGPGKDIIWCRMLADPTGQMVIAAGMSGSPCFIDGKNMGALAYGWSFNKDPVFGVQPIESMLELLDFKGNKRLPRRTRLGFPVSLESEKSFTIPSPFLKSLSGFVRLLPSLADVATARFLPIPLETGSLHPNVVDLVHQALREAGFFPTASSGGGTAQNLSKDTKDLQPGAPITGVIMRGDLQFAATGTLTWREGDKVLAFGHPFLGAGAVRIPMGKAEIVGVISSYERSFKMSNKGPIVGTITQDRMSAVCGTLGLDSPMTPLSLTVDREGHKQTYRVEFCDNKFFTPIVYQTALLQFLSINMERTDEATLTLQGEIQLEGHPPLRFEDSFAGERFSWAAEAVRTAGAQLMPLYQNSFGTPKILKINLAATILPVIHSSTLEEFSADLREARPGDTLQLRATLRPWHGKAYSRTFSIRIPEEVKNGEIELILADANRANQLTGYQSPLSVMTNNFPSSGSDPRNLDQLIQTLNRRHQNNHLYLILQHRAEGLTVQEQRLTALPESVRKLLLNDVGSGRLALIGHSILSQTDIPFDSVVEGNRSIKIRIK